MESFEGLLKQQSDSVLNYQPSTECVFKYQKIEVLDNGRFQIKITCDNEWLQKAISVITNNNQIGITPFGAGHIAKLNAHDEQGGLVVLYGYFSEEDLRELDENLYIDGICKTLTYGSTEEFFGSYG